jgi:hypothetical protein
LFAACAPAPTPASPDEPVTSEPSQPPVNTPSNPEPGPANPYAPQPGDETLARSSAFMSSADLLIMESFPVQIALILSGNLPTPCHDLRAVIHEPDNDNTIEVEIYSVSDPDAICVQVLQSFEARIPMGSFPTGHYTISVNGQRVGEFDS